MNTGIMFRFENAGAEGVELDATESLEAGAEANAAVEEQLGASEELSQVETGIENAGEAQAELAEVTETMEAAAEDGGMTEREAIHVEARIANIAKLLGTTPEAMGLSFRRESFGSTQNRLAVTKMKLEAIKEWPKKIWEALVKAWAWLRDAVTNFFQGLSKNAEAIEKSLKDQATRIAAAKSTGNKKDKLSNGAKLFSIGGSTSADTVKKLLANVAVFEETIKIGAGMGAAQIGNLPTDANGVKTLVGNITGVIAPSAGVKASKTADGKTFGLYVGNGQALCASVKKEKLGESEVDSVALSVESADDKTADEYSAMNLADLKDINTAALAAVGVLKNFQKTEKQLKAELDNNVAFCKKQISIAEAASKGEDADSKNKREALDFARLANNATISASKTLVNKLPTAGLSLVKGAKDLVDAGLGNLKGEEAKTEKK